VSDGFRPSRWEWISIWVSRWTLDHTHSQSVSQWQSQ